MYVSPARELWVSRPPGLTVVVAAGARGRGVGTALCRFALAWARAFEIVGTVPGAFDHPSAGRVGLHVMYREL